MRMILSRLSLGLLLASVLCDAQQYLISTLAGGAPPPTPAPATSLALGAISGLTVDSSGSAYFSSGSVVFRVDTAGTITRFAGTRTAGYSGDGGQAMAARLNRPAGLAFDRQGNLFIADFQNSRIRRVSPAGTITTVMGGGSGFVGSGGPATAGTLNPVGIAVDGQGSLYVSDLFYHVVLKVGHDGIATRIAGGGLANPGDGGPATSALLLGPYSLAVDSHNNLYIVDTICGRLRKVSPDGVITTVSITGPNSSSLIPGAVAVDSQDNLFVADTGSGSILKVAANGAGAVVAGGGTNYPGDGGPATSASVAPAAFALDGKGNLFIADSRFVAATITSSGASAGLLRKVSPDGIITTIAGGGAPSLYSGDGGPALNATLNAPDAVAVDGQGNRFVADSFNHRIRRIAADGSVTTVAGTGVAGFSGDGAAAVNARLNHPNGVAVDNAGNLYIADSYNNRIRRVSPDGVITTVAGNGTFGYSGDGGMATAAALNPQAVAVDTQGNLFIADNVDHVVRRASANGIIDTVAGNGTHGFSGDGGPAVKAQLAQPTGVAVDRDGNLLIADLSNARVRMVSSDGTITTVAGGGGNSANGGPATGAFVAATAVAADREGNFFIAGDDQVWKVSPAAAITTIAGNNTRGYAGDGGLATSASLNGAQGVAVDNQGNVYVAETPNNIIRMLQPADQSTSITAIVDAASESNLPVSPGKIVVIYGTGLGPAQLVQNQPANGFFGTQLAGTSVSFNGTLAPVLYTSVTSVAAIAPYAIAGASTAAVTVTFQGQPSNTFTVPVASAAPSFFSLNVTGAGQIAAVNPDESINDPVHPAKTGSYISLYATGEGQTSPVGVDGKLALTQPYPMPLLRVKVTIGGIPATVLYAGAAPTSVAGLMQVVARIPDDITPGGYVPVVLQSGDASTVDGAAWIAVSAN